MGVKGIFKILIGTIVLIVLASAIVEFFNVITISAQIRQLSEVAAEQSAILFSQETYRIYNEEGRLAGAVGMDDVVGSDGSLFVSGDFYEGESSEEIYSNLYINNTEFSQWLNSSVVKSGGWRYLDVMRGVEKSGDGVGLAVGDLRSVFIDTMVTPTNLGIPYLDTRTTSNMFRWNLAKLFSDNNPYSIMRNENNIQYVSFKGFEVYAQLAQITSIDYITLDLTTESGARDFMRLTNIDPDNLTFFPDAYGTDERQRVLIAGIEFTVPVSYKGITPLRNIFEFVWNRTVSGFNNESINSGEGGYYNWVRVQTELGGGGIGLVSEGDLENMLLMPDRLIFNIVR